MCSFAHDGLSQGTWTVRDVVLTRCYSPHTLYSSGNKYDVEKILFSLSFLQCRITNRRKRWVEVNWTLLVVFYISSSCRRLQRQHHNAQVAHKCVSPPPISHGGEWLSVLFTHLFELSCPILSGRFCLLSTWYFISHFHIFIAQQCFFHSLFHMGESGMTLVH